MQRTSILGFAALSLAGLTAVLVACAEAPPADLDQLKQEAQPTEPEDKITVPAPEPPKEEPKQEEDAGPPPPPPPPFTPENCDPLDTTYGDAYNAANIAAMFGGPPIETCPCAEGQCCYRMELLEGSGFYRDMGCVAK